MPKRVLPDPLPISEILDFLFHNIRKEGGREFSEYEVAKGINIGTSTLKAIRDGKTLNPGLDTIRNLCRFFGVPLTVFQCGSLEEIRNILETQRQVLPNEGDKNPVVQEIMLRSSNLSEAGKRDILKLVKMVGHAEAYRKGEVSRLAPDKEDNDVAAQR